MTDYVALEKPIATIDIETLSLAQNAVVMEIGVIVTSVLPLPGRLWSEEELVDLTDAGLIKFECLFPSITEQVLLGGHVDQGTVKFHTELYAKRGMKFVDEMNELQRCGIAQCSLDLQGMLVGGSKEEIWFNHPQFDVTRMTWMFTQAGVKELPWRYRAEADVATAVRMYRQHCKRTGDQDLTRVFPKQEKAHTGIADCLYNLAAISAAGAFSGSDKLLTAYGLEYKGEVNE